MRVEYLGTKGTWREVADSANTTIHKDAGTKEPSSQWKRKMLLCEHSPIRQIFIKCKWYDLKSWVSVHFVRHKIGIEHWVRTQRVDRTGINRDELPQGNEVEHEILADVQAIINISRKRLCNQASKETRDAWQAVLDSLKEEQPELYNVCVPDCIYRGWCYEYKSCGYHQTPQFQDRLKKYREGIND
ncbi:MAG: thymidylate synthase ThyX [Bacillota bacterium]|nr:thymidylate synthase ThyX [Bacillota bacterium]